MAYSLLEFAFDVLKNAPIPLTYQEIWAEGKSQSLTARLKTFGKTPWDSLGSQL